MSEIKLNEYEVLNDLLLLQWGDGSENALTLKSLRDNCPCANCAGETAVSYTHLTLPTTTIV